MAEDEAAYRNTRLTMMAVPVKLVPKVQKMIAKLAGHSLEQEGEPSL